jgi:hypothetical protein
MTTRLLSSLRRVTLAAEHARNVDLTIGDASDSDETATLSVRGNLRLADEEVLRGIPVIIPPDPRPLGFEARRKGL